MAIQFNPFTGTLDFVGGAGITTWLAPVANEAALPLTDIDGAARVTLDTSVIYVFDTSDNKWHRQVPLIAAFSGTPNASGLSITETTVGDISSFDIALHPADSTNPGAVSTGTQNFAGDKTFDNNVTITGNLTVNGTTTSVNSTTLDVTDANITVNNNGNQSTADLNDAGITVEMSDATDAVIGYDSTLASKFHIGEVGSVAEIADVSSSQTITNKNLASTTNVLTSASADSFTRATGNQQAVSIPDTATPDSIVLTGFTQTLTNKTMDADNNTFSNFEHGQEVDDPVSGVHGVTGNVVGDSDTQTLTNKTIDADNNTISNLAHGAEVDDPTSGVHGVVGNIVGDTDTQTLTNKTIDADLNTITNIEDADIKVGAAINAEKIHDGSVDNTEFGYLDGLTGPIQTQLDGLVAGPASATDEAIARFDTTTGKLVQDSLITIRDDGDLVTPLARIEAADFFPEISGDDIPAVVIDGTTTPATDAAYAAFVITGSGADIEGIFGSTDRSDGNSTVPVYFQSGFQSGTSSTGSVFVASGDSSGTGGSTGLVRVTSGNHTATSGSSGALSLKTGASTNGNSGSIEIVTGIAGNTRGGLLIDTADVTMNIGAIAMNSSGVITLNGTSIDASTSQINNVVDPTLAQDAATKNYVDTTAVLASPGDISEASFALAQSQTGQTVTGLAFANGVVRGAKVEYTVVIDADSDLFEKGELDLIQKAAGSWVLSRESTGDDSLVDLDVDATGQIIYTTPAYTGFSSGTIKFRAQALGV